MIEDGSNVTIHYKLTIDGEVVDTSEGRDPLTYVQGESQIIPGLEEHLSALSEGDVTSVSVPPEKAYGARNPEASVEVAKEAFDEPEKLQVGTRIQAWDTEGRKFSALVEEVADETVTLDLNHPLAGRTLDFDVEILEVKA